MNQLNFANRYILPKKISQWTSENHDTTVYSQVHNRQEKRANFGNVEPPLILPNLLVVTSNTITWYSVTQNEHPAFSQALLD